ncbi:MAG: hypothetical protein IJT60_03440 [Clostridia bacterium]|nr:hypothetical protein [Clostridia bacterium]
MITIKTFQGVTRYIIEGERIKDFNTLQTLYLIRQTEWGLTFCDFYMRKLFFYEGQTVRDLNRQILYRFDGTLFQDYLYRHMYRFEGGYVKTPGFVKLYSVEGPVSSGVIALLITAFEKGYLRPPQ